jgi:hypothetical protein
MKAFIAALLFCLCLGGPAFGQDLNLGGYLSFDYKKGFNDGPFLEGRVGGLEGGLAAAGYLNTRFQYALELSVRPQEDLSLEQAWVSYNPSRSFSLRFGLIPVPFGRFNLINRPHLSTLVLPPLNAAELLPHRWREIGVEVSGEISGFSYEVYLGNGLKEAGSLSEGQQFADNNADKGWGFRVTAALSDNLSAGYSRYQGRYDDENSRALKMQALVAQWATRRILLAYERIWTKMANPEGFEPGEASGDYVVASLVSGRLRPFASYQRLKIEDPFHGPWFGTGLAEMGINRQGTRWAAGLIFQPADSLFFKGEYDWNREESGEEKGDLLTVQIALRF